MRRIIRFIDWRLVLAIAFLLLVGAVVQSSLDTAHDRDRLAAEVIRKDRVASAEREAASAERARLLEGQQRLERKYDALLSQQARLVSWLNGRGIFIPQAVFEVGSDDGDDSDSDGGSGSGSSSTGGSGKQLPPKSGPASPSHPVPHSPGGSGKGQGAGGGHDKGHRGSASQGGSKGKAKGHTKARGHKGHGHR